MGAGAGGIVFLPYLLGERAPLWDDELRGAFIGLALQHGYPHLLRAVFEGVAFGLRNLSDAVMGAGGKMNELRVCGGTAHYELLNQIKADVLGVSVVVPTVIEASLLGAAILAAKGVALQQTYAEAVGQMVHTARRLEPDAARRATYEDTYEKFLTLTQMRIR